MQVKEFSFEKLNVWQKSRVLVKEIYSNTKLFPQDERYGLCSQMQRAAISVMSNIAEGSSRKSKKDQSNFYQIGYSSLMELINDIIIIRDLEFIKQNEYEKLRNMSAEVSMMLNALYVSIRGKNA